MKIYFRDLFGYINLNNS